MSIDANAIENSNIDENHVGKFASLSRSNRFLVSVWHLYEIEFIIRKTENDKYEGQIYFIDRDHVKKMLIYF